MKIKIFLLLFLPCFCLCNEDFCRVSKSFLLYNHVLVGHVIKTLLTRGIFSCAHKCLSLSSCSSYNYETSAMRYGVCELNGASAGGKQQNLTEKYGFAFAQIQRKQVRGFAIMITITLSQFMKNV